MVMVEKTDMTVEMDQADKTVQVERLKTLPAADGFHMPGEFEPHKGTIMIWPERPGSWAYGAKDARKAFAKIAEAIAEGEDVYMLASWEKDDAAAEAICDALDYPVYDVGDFVLEGGSIHSDGEGTLLVTEACLLSPGRNPHLTKEEIEKKLCEYLGAEKVIWLKNGIWQDETNEHIDNVCAFVKPGEVVLAWTDDEKDPQYALSMEDYQILENETDAKGRKFMIHKLPIPEKPVCIQEQDLKGLMFEPGEDTREAGERLAASYVNFYIANEAVLVPQFQDKHDKLACDILGKLFPDRRICPIDARAIIIGGGNIHCITQQIPSGIGK